jgi:hypothetical protein
MAKGGEGEGAGAGLEVADEEADRQVGGDGGDHHAEQDLAVDMCVGGTSEGRENEDAERRLKECGAQAEQFTERACACRGESCARRGGRFRWRSTA